MQSKPTFDELITTEARRLAKLYIEKSFEESTKFPLSPADLESMIDRALEKSPDLYEIAKRNIEARLSAQREGLTILGIGPSTSEIEIDL